MINGTISNIFGIVKYIIAIPKYNEVIIPALNLLTKHHSLRRGDFVEPLAAEFGLTREEVNKDYPSGNGPIFYDRITWALSGLYRAGLVQRPKRGVYQISELGRTHLVSPENIHSFIADQNQNLANQRPTTKPAIDDEEESSNSLTPQEGLSVSSEKIKELVYEEIIDAILGKTPREFEKLVVLLLQRMGYGGEVKESGEVTPSTHDKGIDGIIKEDKLGLGRIHIQAKRYARENHVSRDEVHKFVGALAGAGASKGVFITTSQYKKSALEYVNTLRGSHTIVLIDGMQLAEYIYEHNVGVHVEQTIELKILDNDFWDSMESDAGNS